MSGSSTAHKIAAASKPVWHLVDAEGQVVGRLATQIATLLTGKHKPVYVPSIDVGDYVVVVNASKVALSGTKAKTKLYRWHTGYPGGLKTLTARHMFERAPERVLEKAVLGMLPKTKLKPSWAKKLRIFPGEEHTHAANLKGSQAYAPDFVDAYLPKRVELREKEETGHFVVDYVPEEGEALEEVDLRAEWEELMAAEQADLAPPLAMSTTSGASGVASPLARSPSRSLFRTSRPIRTEVPENPVSLALRKRLASPSKRPAVSASTPKSSASLASGGAAVVKRGPPASSPTAAATTPKRFVGRQAIRPRVPTEQPRPGPGAYGRTNTESSLSRKQSHSKLGNSPGARLPSAPRGTFWTPTLSGGPEAPATSSMHKQAVSHRRTAGSAVIGTSTRDATAKMYF